MVLLGGLELDERIAGRRVSGELIASAGSATLALGGTGLLVSLGARA
jgi:hypothetical protein